MLGQFGSLVPGQGATELFGQSRELCGDGGVDGFGTVTGQWCSVLDRRQDSVAFHRGQVQQHRVPGRAFHQRADGRLVQPDDQIAFPVPGHRPVGDLGGTLADLDLVSHELFAPTLRACPRNPQRPPGPQTRTQFAFERTTPLDVERLVDRLVADPHRLILREFNLEPLADLLRAPRAGPQRRSRRRPCRRPAQGTLGPGTGRPSASLTAPDRRCSI